MLSFIYGGFTFTKSGEFEGRFINFYKNANLDTFNSSQFSGDAFVANIPGRKDELATFDAGKCDQCFTPPNFLSRITILQLLVY